MCTFHLSFQKTQYLYFSIMDQKTANDHNAQIKDMLSQPVTTPTDSKNFYEDFYTNEHFKSDELKKYFIPDLENIIVEYINWEWQKFDGVALFSIPYRDLLHLLHNGLFPRDVIFFGRADGEKFKMSANGHIFQASGHFPLSFCSIQWTNFYIVDPKDDDRFLVGLARHVANKKYPVFEYMTHGDLDFIWKKGHDPFAGRYQRLVLPHEHHVYLFRIYGGMIGKFDTNHFFVRQ